MPTTIAGPYAEIKRPRQRRVDDLCWKSFEELRLRSRS
jgi:hypothetical protein